MYYDGEAMTNFRRVHKVCGLPRIFASHVSELVTATLASTSCVYSC